LHFVSDWDIVPKNIISGIFSTSGDNMKLALRMSTLLALIGTLFHVAPAAACGGLFCQNIPVDQAGEQILFHQEGESITAMVRILYEGDADNFSWVVPVPNTPELSTGADSFFDELDVMTRPVFDLSRTGNGECSSDFLTGGTDGATGGGSPVTAEADSGGVTIEQELSVGPFEIQIISSDNPDDLAIWLADNEYDLSDRGRDLIAPYVEMGMKFVALKLRSGQSSGSIQPLVMKYQSSKPMVPIKLTAVAAQEDMGVLVWLVSDARAVPDNYLHVIPNYTQLNWYTGPNNAYGSYQTLITAAMDEAGGQGFATDFAGSIDEAITSFITQADSLDAELAMLDGLGNDSDFLAALYSGNRSEALRGLYTTFLPLPSGQDEGVYSSPMALQAVFTQDELAQAREKLRQAFIDIEIEPLRASNALLTDGRYLTRLYTTLSADEMTLDPSFEFNPNMETQARLRQATLDVNCVNDETLWSLTLGAGTGRDGETVIQANEPTPQTVPVAAQTQRAVFTASVTSGDAMPDVKITNSFELINVNITGEEPRDRKFLGALSYWAGCVFLLAIFMRRRKVQM